MAQQTERFEKTRANEGKLSAAKRPEQKKTVWTKQNKGVDARNAKDKYIEEVESNVLARSREQLEKKAKIYEAMRSGHIQQEYSEYDDDEKAPLIDFDKKYLQEVKYHFMNSCLCDIELSSCVSCLASTRGNTRRNREKIKEETTGERGRRCG